MKTTTFAASCTLLCALLFPALSAHSAPSPSPTIATIDEGLTIVIRYDAEAIFLTHELVAPLCSREVELTHDSVQGLAGGLVMERMDSNELQPKGVFVGRVRVDWAAGSELSAEQREAVLEAGLEQLRSALEGRLVQSRQLQLGRRAFVLEAMEDELRRTADAKAQELARRDELVDANRELEEAQAKLRGLQLERRAAQQDLMIATTGVQEYEAKLETANAMVHRVQVELVRVRELVDNGVSSTLDLGATEQRLQTAMGELQIASAQVDNQRMQVVQRSHQVEATEQALVLLEVKVASLQERIAALASEETSDTDATLRLGHATDHGRLTELGTELQRARAALATITEVTLERW